MNFDSAFDVLLGEEGKYSNNSLDPGGETMWGITRRTASRYGYTGDMRLLPRDTAKTIAKAEYWDVVRCDEMPSLLRFPLFDATFNSGAEQAVKWLQRAVGVVDDGELGPVTMTAVGAANAAKTGLLYEAGRLDFLASLPTWAAFGKGWSRRISINLQQIAAEVL